MKKLLLLSIVLFGLSSCGAFKFTTYDVSLAKVEIPQNVKEKYGTTDVVILDESGKTNYKYENDLFNILWYATRSQLNFSIKNKSDYSIKILWDEAVFIDQNGKTGRVMHDGIKYIDRNNSMPASVIPKGTSLDDMIVPTSNVYYSSGSGWRTSDLLYVDQNVLKSNPSAYEGVTIKVLLPLEIEGVKNEYTFEFDVNNIQIK